MSIQKSSVPLALVSCLFFATVGSAQFNVRTKTIEQDGALERLRKTMDTATSEKSVLAEDRSRRWLVSELKISGNKLISTEVLLEKLPWTYIEYEIDPATGKPKKQPTTGVPIVKDFYDFRVLIEIIVNPGQEREVSLKTIHGFTKYVSGLYQDKGYSGIYVYVPKEAVDREGRLVGETLPIRVLEAKVAEIRVERYDFDRQKQEKGFLKDSVLKSWSPVKEGQVIQKKQLDDFLNLLNLNPDRYVSAITSRSDEPNAVDLTYDVYEANPWHLYLQVDNSGTKDRQWAPRIGVINTNLRGIDDRFTAMYQAPWEKGIEDTYSLYGSYDFPLIGPRLRFNIYGGYSQFDIPAKEISFLGNGSFYGGILSYNVYQMGNLFVDVTGSVSQEKSKVTPSLGLASEVDMDLWGVGVNVHRSDDRSNTFITFNRTASMGGSSKDEFMLARVDTDPYFTIYNFVAAHSRYLDADKVNRLSGSFRLIDSDERLVPAKMTPFGGLYTVRGYKEDEIVADGGILLTGQYEFDLVGEEKRTLEPWIRKLAPLAFVDYGRAKIKKPVVGEREVRELCSIGTGAIIELGDDFGDDFSASIYYGWPLRGADETDRGNARWNFIFVYRHRF